MSLLNNAKFKRAESSNDYSTLLELLTPLAQNGCAEAQCYLASMYHTGNGVTPNGLIAAHWYELAANQGFGLASNNLSCLYATGGPNLAENPHLSDHWRQKSLEQGFPL